MSWRKKPQEEPMELVIPDYPWRYPKGVWVIYDYDQGPYAITIAHNSEGAIVKLGAHGYGKIAWWPFNMGFREAIKEWEEQP